MLSTAPQKRNLYFLQILKERRDGRASRRRRLLGSGGSGGRGGWRHERLEDVGLEVRLREALVGAWGWWSRRYSKTTDRGEGVCFAGEKPTN